MDALRDATWTRPETLAARWVTCTRPPVRRPGNQSRRRGWQTYRTKAQPGPPVQQPRRAPYTLFPSPLAFVTETEMLHKVLVDRVSRAPSPIQGIPERQPYVDPRMLHADAPGHCAWLLGVGPAQPLCVLVYHYPRVWCPVEVGSGPAKTRRPPPHQKRWCPVEVSRPGPP